MVSSRGRACCLLLTLPVLLVAILGGPALAHAFQLPIADQGGSFIPASATNATPQLLPSANPLSPLGSADRGPVGSNVIPLSSGMFSGIMPRIPNLELGFLYNFGNNVRSGRFTADYLLPFNLNGNSILFGEAHCESQDFWKTQPGGSEYRVDLSLGGGYRGIFGESTLLGINGFYDTSKLFGKWHSSGGFGLEMAALVGGDGAIDLNFNWYGNIFTRDGIINAFRNKGVSYDVEAGYSQPLFNRGVDLRLKATGYQFDVGSAVYGWRTGADLTTRDGVFSLRYEYGHDKINGSYNTVGGFVNVGFQLENILKGESPFVAPEPVFQSPRNLRRWLTQKVKRNWHQPSAVALTRQGQGGQGPSRYLASIPMVGTIWLSVYESDGPNLIILFDESVPYALLDPTKFVTVELTYEFDQVPTSGTADWNIFVVGSFGWWPFNFTQPTIPTNKAKDHIVFTLIPGQPDDYQLAFTSTATDPIGIGFQVGAAGTSWMKVTDITVHFNQ